MSPAQLSPLKVGVIGLGRFGRLHALTLAGLAEAELVALVARRQHSLDVLAKELPGVRGWTSLSQALDESDAEAWVIACSTTSHVPVAREVLERGKMVLLEKPIADDMSEARSLAPLVRPDSANLMMGHIVLFNSEFRELCSVADKRGPISYIDCVRHRPASIVRDFPGENPLHAVMVHDLYAALVLIKRAEPDYFNLQYHRTGDGNIDLALARIGWGSGAVASFAASYLTPVGMPPRGFDRTEVFGEGWSARISPNPRPIEVWDSQAAWPLPLEIRTDPVSGMLAEELRCFARAARGIQPVPVGATFHDAIRIQEWMERLSASAK